MGGGLWFVVDVGEWLPSNRTWDMGGAAALRCKHFDARGKKQDGMDGWTRKDVIRSDW